MIKSVPPEIGRCLPRKCSRRSWRECLPQPLLQFVHIPHEDDDGPRSDRWGNCSAADEPEDPVVVQISSVRGVRRRQATMRGPA